MAKALVLFSGGLDSRLAIKILQEQGINVAAVMFKLPFSGGCCNNELCSFRFSQLNNVHLHIVDCTKGKLFQEYLKTIKNPRFGRGAGVNPCIDCRIFILKKAQKFMKKLKCDFIATGEVLGERPMSQHKRALEIIEKEVELEDKILRPLSAKLLPETQAEKLGLVDREKLLSIRGRSRKPQIALAAKYKIKYPHPAGGCILCEKDYARKLSDLFESQKIIKPEHIESLRLGRHFRSKENQGKIILGRNHQENLLLEELNKKLKYNIIIPSTPGPTALFKKSSDKMLAEQIISAYSKGNEKRRQDFKEFKIGNIQNPKVYK